MKRLPIAAIAVALLALSGCSAEPELNLADSKTPAQLLLTEAVNRLPDFVFADTGAITDGSVACKDEDKDPDGLYRSWQSTAVIPLYDAAADDVNVTVDQLVATFLDQGWQDKSLGGAGTQHNRFIWSEQSLALLRVTGEHLGTEAMAVTTDGTVGAEITIETSGPCVLTGGPESDEVKILEKRD